MRKDHKPYDTYRRNYSNRPVYTGPRWYVLLPAMIGFAVCSYLIIDALLGAM